MSETETPDRPPTVLWEGQYHWGKSLGTVCPSCAQIIRWRYDGALYHGRCACDWRHLSTKEHIWPDV
jgi:hypothetical protein